MAEKVAGGGGGGELGGCEGWRNKNAGQECEEEKKTRLEPRGPFGILAAALLVIHI